MEALASRAAQHSTPRWPAVVHSSVAHLPAAKSPLPQPTGSTTRLAHALLDTCTASSCAASGCTQIKHGRTQERGECKDEC